MKKIGIIGLGLIGGSYGLALKETGHYRIYGWDNRQEHLQTALDREIIDQVLKPENLSHLDGMILSVPVDKLPSLATEYLDKTPDNTWIFDTGSIKNNIAVALGNHPARERFILSHPIAGTEYSGPSAAKKDLFNGKINIITDPEQSRPEFLEEVKKLHENLGMQNFFMSSAEHDKHIAYVSHLSHVSAFMLGKTVLEVEKDEKNIFLMAGSGFASTVRLAKSSPHTWTPVFGENRREILKVLKAYRDNLNDFIRLLETGNREEIFHILQDINRIGTVIDRINRNHGKS